MATYVCQPHRATVFKPSTSSCARTDTQSSSSTSLAVRTEELEMGTDEDTCSSSPAAQLQPPLPTPAAPPPPPPPPPPAQAPSTQVQVYHHQPTRRYNNYRRLPRMHGPRQPFDMVPMAGPAMPMPMHPMTQMHMYPPMGMHMPPPMIAPPIALGPQQFITMPQMDVQCISGPLIDPNVPPNMMSSDDIMYLSTLSDNVRELFIHIQIKESLDVAFGPDIRQVQGPATILMIGEPIYPSGGMPIRLPPGHQMHQVLDENQGCLRHVILSLEEEGESNPDGAMRVHTLRPNGQSSSQTIFQPKRIVTRNGPTTVVAQNGARKKDFVPRKLRRKTDGASTSAGVRERSTDSDENEKLLELMNRVLVPGISNLGVHEATITWNAIDTSEAAAPGGQFPQIDCSEFRYKLVVTDSFAHRTFGTYTIEGAQQNRLKLTGLRPYTQYHVQMKGSLVERGITNNYCNPVFFETYPGRPEAPTNVRIVNVGTDHVQLTWVPASENGSAITNFRAYVHPMGETTATNIVDFGLMLEGKIGGLTPGIHYMVRLVAINMTGESDDVKVVVCTRGGVSNQPPPAPVASLLCHQSVTLTWIFMQGYNYYMEMYDDKTEKVVALAKPLSVYNLVVQNLKPNTEYKFRLCAQNTLGEAQRSEWMSARTTGSPNEQIVPPMITLDTLSLREKTYQHILKAQEQSKDELNKKHTVNVLEFLLQPEPFPIPERKPSLSPSSSVSSQEKSKKKLKGKELELPPLIPSKPFPSKMVKGRLQVAWKYLRPKDRDIIFNLEGSSLKFPKRFRTLYKGNNTSYTIYEEDVQFVRVQAISKSGNHSSYSDTLKMYLDEEAKVAVVKKLQPPTFTQMGHKKVLAKWTPLTSRKVVYELRKIDGTNNATIYTGEEAQFILTGVEPCTSVSVQIRAIVSFDKEYKIEGEWSETATERVNHIIPPSPNGLLFDQKTCVLSWDCLKSDVLFKVNIYLMHTLEEVQVIKTKEKSIHLDFLLPNQIYLCNMTSWSNGEESLPSEMLKIDRPANVPSQPESASAVATSNETLLIRWTHGDDGGRPIEQYRIDVREENTVIRQDVVTFNPSSQELSIDGLEPNKLYHMEIRAENEVGLGHPVKVSAKTKRTTLLPAELHCDSDPTCLKLHWSSNYQEAGLCYRVVILGKNGAKNVVYEGEAHSTKVRSLTQDTEYTFLIRTFSKTSTAEVWSEPYIFRTAMAPPPFVRQPATAQTIKDQPGFCQITWQSVIPEKTTYKIFYRLQAVESNAAGKWHTIYEGTCTSFKLKSSNYDGAIQLRVLCVRKDANGEMSGQASPVTYFSNEPAALTSDMLRERSTENLFACVWKKCSIPIITFIIVAFLGLISCWLAMIFYPAVDTEKALKTVLAHQEPPKEL